MLDSVDTAAASPGPDATRKPPLLARPGVIGATGAFSLIAGALIGDHWISAHRFYWSGEFWCSASFSIPTSLRHSVTVVAVVAALLVTATLGRIGWSGVRSRLLITYWTASVVLWLALGRTFVTGVEARMCARGL